MELRILRYFLVVAREENLTKAAKLLHITQPTLSRQIMQLEEEFGVKLFRRSNHSIILTPEGLLLRRRAQEMVDLADKTAQELATPEEMIAGEISIGCGETENVTVIAKIMKAFQSVYPGVYFSLYTGIADDVKERLEKGLLDFGVVIEPVDISKYNFLELPYKDVWVALVRQNHALAEKEAIYPEDLIGCPLILASRDSVKNLLDQWFGPYANDMYRTAYLNLSAYNKNILVSEGIGVALGLQFKTYHPELRMIPLEPRLECGSYFVWKKHQESTATIKRFIEFAREYLKVRVPKKG